MYGLTTFDFYGPTPPACREYRKITEFYYPTPSTTSSSRPPTSGRVALVEAVTGRPEPHPDPSARRAPVRCRPSIHRHGAPLRLRDMPSPRPRQRPHAPGRREPQLQGRHRRSAGGRQLESDHRGTASCRSSSAGITFGTVYALVSLGVVVIYRVSRVINLGPRRHRRLRRRSSSTTTLVGDLGLPVAVAVRAARLLVGAALGVVVERLFVGPVRPDGLARHPDHDDRGAAGPHRAHGAAVGPDQPGSSPRSSPTASSRSAAPG